MSGTLKYIRELDRYISERMSQKSFICFEPVYSAPKVAEHDVDDFLKKMRSRAFRDKLFHYIDRKGWKDSDIYQKAGLDRRHFYKIRTFADYRPHKSTVIALILALELDIHEAEDLLKTGGYSLSNADTFDLIIRFCLEKGIYSLFEVNGMLEHYQQRLLG